MRTNAEPSPSRHSPVRGDSPKPFMAVGAPSIMARGAVGLVVLIPTVASATFTFSFVVPKAILLRLGGLLLLSILVALVFTRTSKIQHRDLPSVILVGFVAGSGLMALLGVMPLRSLYGDVERMSGLLTWLALAAYYASCRTFLAERDWRHLLRLTLIVAVAACGYALLAYLATGDTDGTFGNPSYLGIYSVLVVGGAALIGLDDQQRRGWRVLAAVVALMALLCVYVTTPRAAVLGLGAGLATGAIVYAAASRVRLRRTIGIAAIAIIVSMAAVAAWSNFSQDDTSSSGVVATLEGDRNIRYRLFMWEAALRGAADRPLLGHGLENFAVVYSRHFDPRTYHIGGSTYPDRAHNAYLDVLVGAGVPGLLLYLGFWASLFVQVRRGLRAGRLRPFEAAALTGIFTAYATYLFFWFEDLSSIVLLVMFAAFASHRAAGGPLIEFGERRRLTPLRGFIVAAAIALIAVIGYQHAIRVGLAARAAQAATVGQVEERLANYEKALAYRSPEAAELVVRHVNYLQSFTDELPAIREDPYRFGILDRSVQAAFVSLDDAVAMDPQNDFWRLDRGSLLAFAAGLYGDRRYLELAIEDMNEAIALSPNRLRHYHFLTDLHLLAGDHAVAERTIASALEIYSEFGETYVYRARLRSAQGDVAAATADLEHAMALDYTPPPGSVRSVATALIAGGQTTEAERLITAYLERRAPLTETWLRQLQNPELDPDVLWIARTLPELYRSRGGVTEADAAAARWPVAPDGM